MGVDVASFGDFFAEQRLPQHSKSTSVQVKAPGPATSAPISHNQKSGNKHGVWEITSEAPTAQHASIASTRPTAPDGTEEMASAPKRRHGAAAAAEGPIETLTYRDPFAGVYKKFVSSYIFSRFWIDHVN